MLFLKETSIGKHSKCSPSLKHASNDCQGMQMIALEEMSHWLS